MVIVSGNRRMWWVGMAVSVIIFAVLYFTVIRPDNNTANQAVQAGLKQTQQVIKQAQQQVGAASGQASAASGQASAASKQASNVAATGQKVLNKAAKLTSCLITAGTDTSKVAACQTQFGS
jgi:hypothetical protein